MKRTSLFLDDELVEALGRMAKRRRVSLSQVVREAAAAYVARAAPRVVPAIAGAYATGETDVAERAHERLWTDPHA